jgi:hypothetical protein
VTGAAFREASHHLKQLLGSEICGPCRNGPVVARAGSCGMRALVRERRVNLETRARGGSRFGIIGGWQISRVEKMQVQQSVSLQEVGAALN